MNSGPLKRLDNKDDLLLFPELQEEKSGVLRKNLLYKSGFGFYCINHVQGCSHGCRYPCFAWMMSHSHRRINSYTEWREPKLVTNAYELLRKELSRMRKKPENIHLCLSTDPFMTGHPEVIAMSLRLIELINSFGISCSLLSKGFFPPALAETDRFCADNMHGISLVSLDESFRERWEPGTTPYLDRIKSLKYLHEKSRRTRVHMEPYPTPNIVKQSLEKILEKISFVDEIFLGGWNYNKIVKEYIGYEEYYKRQSEIVRSFCEDKGILMSS